MALIAHYKFEDNWLDAMGANNATPSAGGTSFAAGKYGRGAAFDGAAGYANTSGPVLTTNGTVAAWAKWSSGSVLMRDATGNAGVGWLLAYASGSNVAARVADTSIVTTALLATAQNGQFHHYAICKSGGTVKVYFDDSEVGSATGVANTASVMPWYIGKNGSVPGQFTACTLDDLRIYNTNEAANITAIMNDSGAKAHIYICCQGGD